MTLEIPFNQKVTLSCDTNSTDANPKCDTVLWNKIDDDTGQFPIVMFTDTIEFVMQDTSVGNYTCQCRNEYGLSEVSMPAELTVIHSEITGKDAYSFLIHSEHLGGFLCVGIFLHEVYLIFEQRYKLFVYCWDFNEHFEKHLYVTSTNYLRPYRRTIFSLFLTDAIDEIIIILAALMGVFILACIALVGYIIYSKR